MLTKFQSELMPLLTVTRSEKSYFAGGTALNFSLPRRSSDFDIFHDDVALCASSFVTDIDYLRQNGFQIDIIRTPEKDGIGEIEISKGTESTNIQWTIDSVYRFFPVEKDDEFGFKLNYHDLATNKLLALAGRAEVRDYYDVCEMIRTGKPVVTYVWAACGKDPGYTPNSLLDYMSFNSRYNKDDFLSIHTNQPIDIVQCKNLFQSMLHDAREKFSYAPIDEQGCLYLRKKDLTVFFPSRKDFEEQNYIKHEARVFGSFPTFKPAEEQAESVPTTESTAAKSQKRHRMR